jgi:hypothetical protein
VEEWSVIQLSAFGFNSTANVVSYSFAEGISKLDYMFFL